MKKFKKFEYSPCAVEYTEANGQTYIQVVLPECAEFWGVYGRVNDPVTGHLLAEHIIDVATKRQAMDIVNLLNGML